MTPIIVLSVISAYFILLFIVSQITSRHTTSETFFTADHKSPWYLVAYGMIGVGISGITFISVPGEVGNSQFTYFQLVIGYAIGLRVIALVLLPLFYRLKLVSSYSYLEQRFGTWTYKTGALFFQLAQTFTAAFKLYLMAGVLQISLFDPIGLPFELTVLVTLLLIWLYTVRAGIKKRAKWPDRLSGAGHRKGHLARRRRRRIGVVIGKLDQGCAPKGSRRKLTVDRSRWVSLVTGAIRTAADPHCSVTRRSSCTTSGS